MLKKLLNKIFGKSLEDILGTFHKTLADLEALGAKNDKKIAAKVEQVEKLNTHVGLLQKEKDEAAQVYENIRKLLGLN